MEIVVKDSQSNPNRAAEVASALILSDEVHLLCAANTPETTNPVADQAEINEVPCVTTLCPWQPYFFGRGGDPAAGFLDLWSKVETNKTVGGLFPNDGDGNAWGDPELGFPKPLAAAFTEATGKQWSQPVGYGHSLLEMALDVVARADDVSDPESVLAALVATDLAAVAGPVSWGAGPVKNVARMPLVGGQWRRTPDGPFAYDLAITSNATAPQIPANAEMVHIA